MRFLLTQLNNLPQLPGIYKFYSRDKLLLYVGKAKNLKKRVNNYFTRKKNDFRINKFTDQINYIEIIQVASEFEALLLEAKLIKENQPKYNVVWRDDKHYIYIKITKEKFPKVLFTRKTDAHGDFFGPFPSSTIVKQILSYLRTIFPYCTQKETAKQACFYNHIGLCNPCPAEIVKFTGIKYKLLLREYKENIHNIRHILEGKLSKVKKLLVGEMQVVSQQQNYEKAAVYRDRLNKLEYLLNRYTAIDSYAENPKFLNKIRAKEQNQLLTLLKPYYPKLSQIIHIECYDISNISGKLAAGSMVTFRNGEPDKNLYRRFRIKLKKTPDDFGMLAEMMTRRLNHGQWQLPDLFIIDGGRPQLAALTKVMQTLRIHTPIIGLAKVYEEIVIPSKNSYVRINLPDNSPALNLVKRLRDEAHRFAHSYHSLLRLKYLLDFY